MNILDFYPYPDTIAGSELTMQTKVKALRADGHRIYLVHAIEGEPQAANNYEAVISLPVLFDRSSKLPPSGLRDAEAQVRAFIAKHQIDILHVHGYPRTETLRRFAQSYPIVVTIHVSLCPNGARYLWKERQVCERKVGLGCLTVGYASKGCGHMASQQPMGLPGFVRGMWEDDRLHKAIGRCARVVAPGEWTKQRLITDGIPAEIIRVVNSGITDDSRVAEVVTLEQPPAVLFVGRLVDFKGVDHLLQASALISQPHQIWIVGDGSARAELEQLTEQLGLRDQVRFFGEMTPDKIANYRRKSTVVVVPSLWPETFGRVGPEAMLAERPVVAYRSGSIPEWLKDGINGRLVEHGNIASLAEAIADLLQNPHTAHAMGQAGREIALQWTPQHHVSKLLKVYAEAMAQQQRGAASSA